VLMKFRSALAVLRQSLVGIVYTAANLENLSIVVKIVLLLCCSCRILAFVRYRNY